VTVAHYHIEADNFQHAVNSLHQAEWSHSERVDRKQFWCFLTCYDSVTETVWQDCANFRSLFSLGSYLKIIEMALISWLPFASKKCVLFLTKIGRARYIFTYSFGHPDLRQCWVGVVAPMYLWLGVGELGPWLILVRQCVEIKIEHLREKTLSLQRAETQRLFCLGRINFHKSLKICLRAPLGTRLGSSNCLCT
jgi:hypothetical protein